MLISFIHLGHKLGLLTMSQNDLRNSCIIWVGSWPYVMDARLKPMPQLCFRFWPNFCLLENARIQYQNDQVSCGYCYRQSLQPSTPTIHPSPLHLINVTKKERKREWKKERERRGDRARERDRQRWSLERVRTREKEGGNERGCLLVSLITCRNMILLFRSTMLFDMFYNWKWHSIWR